ncbi:MAG: ribonuclease J [Patescibacteria group bacterium]|jgi:ribonuclease J
MNQKIRVIPMGGLSNVTKNMYAYEYWEEGVLKDILIVDCGVGFLSELETLGVDFVIPDVTYFKDKTNLIRALLITHGHDDHIGAVPYIIPQLKFPPIYAPKLAALLIESKLSELEMRGVNIKQIEYRTDYTFGAFKVRWIHMTHSIPDTTHIFIQSPVGNVYHGSDFKFDLTPLYTTPPDFQEISRASTLGVDLMLSDALGAEREGFTLSERIVGKTFQDEMQQTKGRFFMTTFASNISRVRQCVDAALLHGRKVCFLGRSMKRNMEIAFTEGYIPKYNNLIIDEKEVKRYPPNKVCVILTGSQGEFGAALDKVASRRHAFVRIEKSDRVFFSSDPIPGNEIHVQELIETIIEQGAEVIYTAIRDQLHASGHGSQEDHKLLTRLVKPRYVMPIGTTIKHSRAYANIMNQLGYRDEDIHMMHDGEPLVLEKGKVSRENKIPLKEMLVDGSSIGDVGTTIINERRSLGKEGVLLVVIDGSAVSLESRGFIFYEKTLFKKIESMVLDLLKKYQNREELKKAIENQLGGFIYSQIQRNPVILSIIK